MKGGGILWWVWYIVRQIIMFGLRHDSNFSGGNFFVVQQKVIATCQNITIIAYSHINNKQFIETIIVVDNNRISKKGLKTSKARSIKILMVKPINKDWIQECKLQEKKRHWMPYFIITLKWNFSSSRRKVIYVGLFFEKALLLAKPYATLWKYFSSMWLSSDIKLERWWGQTNARLDNDHWFTLGSL